MIKKNYIYFTQIKQSKNITNELSFEGNDMLDQNSTQPNELQNFMDQYSMELQFLKTYDSS
jgi:hypothetical protein